jgi:hypothetical protein
MIKPIVDNLLKEVNNDPKIQQKIKGLVSYIQRMVYPYIIGIVTLLVLIIVLQIMILKKLP